MSLSYAGEFKGNKEKERWAAPTRRDGTERSKVVCTTEGYSVHNKNFEGDRYTEGTVRRLGLVY